MKNFLVHTALFSLCVILCAASFGDTSQLAPLSPHSKTQYTIIYDAKTTAENQQKDADDTAFTKSGWEDLRTHNFVVAEEDFRAALSIEKDGHIYLGLGEALVGQGRTAEALQAYFSVFHPGPKESWGGSYMPKADLEYALLLNQNGQWAEAAAHYNDALPLLVDFGLKNPVQLDPHAPQPLALTVGAYIGLGLYDNLGYEPDSNTKAFVEYTTALGLAPNWDAANYYYGMGWCRLDLKSSVRAAHAAQAKTALKKAAASEDAVVKKAASETLEGLK